MTSTEAAAAESPSPFWVEAARIAASAELMTRDGTRLHVRPACPNDKGAVARFFRGLSADDLRHRFLTSLREVGGERLGAMVRNDDPHVINLLALDPDTGEIMAIAMLVASAGFADAEFALATRRDSKGRGVSWTLLRHLLDYAQAVGIETLRSVETSDDDRALQLEREMGFRVRLCPEDATLMIAEKTLGRT